MAVPNSVSNDNVGTLLLPDKEQENSIIVSTLIHVLSSNNVAVPASHTVITLISKVLSLLPVLFIRKNCVLVFLCFFFKLFSG